MKARAIQIPAALVVAAFWVGCVAVPLAALFAHLASTQDGGGLSVALADPVLRAIARGTVWQAAWSTVISLALGLPLGLWAGRHLSERRRSGAIARVLLALPYSIPTIVAGLVAVTWMGRTGILARLLGIDVGYSLKAVIIAHVFLNAPWVALLVAQARAQVPRNQLEAAATLGARPFMRARLIAWPYVSSALASAAAQVFSLCVMSFALVLVLGGGPPVQTLETEIYARMRFSGMDISGAAACALVELVVCLAPWILLMLTRRRAARLGVSVPVATPAADARPGGERGAFARGFRGFRASGALLIAACALALAPYIVILVSSPWRLLAQSSSRADLLEPLRISVELAVCVSLGAALTAIAAIITQSSVGQAKRLAGFLGVLFALPAGISVLVVGLGFWLAYQRWIDPFDGSFAAMALVQIALFFPLAYRTLWPVASGSQRVALEAARTLGASPVTAFRFVEWPRWRGPILSVLAMVAGAALGEVAAVSLFYSEKLVPLPLLVSRWFAQYRFEEAQGLAGILLLLSWATAAAVASIPSRSEVR